MKNIFESSVENVQNEFSYVEPTAEEILERKRKTEKEIEEKGFLPVNDEYNETMYSPQEEVENNPKKFIIEECIPACLELWKKNIYTFMVSDYLNEGVCWIEVVADSLSDENKKIYMDLSGDDIIKFSYHQGSFNFGVNSVGKEGQLKLLAIAQKFQMQDVPINQAYLTPTDFLMNRCGCYEDYPNPNYRTMEAPWTLSLPMNELMNYMKKYDEWENSIESKKTLRRYAPEKAVKSVSEYAKEQGMIMEDDRIYLSEFHYNKHLKYIDYLNNELAANVGKKL